MERLDGRSVEEKTVECFRVNILIAIFLSPLSGYALGSVCPDLESPACLEKIDQLISQKNYLSAHEFASEQCWVNENDDVVGELNHKALLAIASSCYRLFSIEQFLGNNLRALEAREKTVAISHWGCRWGNFDLCELLMVLVKGDIQRLLEELSYDLRKGVGKNFREIQIRRIQVPKALPVKLSQHISKTLEAGLGIATKASKESKGHSGALYLLDIEVNAIGSDVSLSAEVTGRTSTKVLWRKTYRTIDYKDRIRYFGFDAPVSQDLLQMKRGKEYEPVYKNLIGLGMARLPNLGGSNSESSRFNVQFRFLESINHRQSEFGALVSLHYTMRAALGQKTDTKDDQGEALQTGDTSGEDQVSDATTDSAGPYDFAVHIYSIFGHMFIDPNQSYDSIRHGINLGIGGMYSSRLIAPSARIGWDMYFGRRYVLSFALVGIGESVILVDGDGSNTKPVLGTTATLSFHL